MRGRFPRGPLSLSLSCSSSLQPRRKRELGTPPEVRKMSPSFLTYTTRAPTFSFVRSHFERAAKVFPSFTPTPLFPRLNLSISSPPRPPRTSRKSSRGANIDVEAAAAAAAESHMHSFPMVSPNAPSFFAQRAQGRPIFSSNINNDFPKIVKRCLTTRGADSAGGEEEQPRATMPCL